MLQLLGMKGKWNLLVWLTWILQHLVERVPSIFTKCIFCSNKKSKMSSIMILWTISIFCCWIRMGLPSTTTIMSHDTRQHSFLLIVNILLSWNYFEKYIPRPWFLVKASFQFYGRLDKGITLFLAQNQKPYLIFRLAGTLLRKSVLK